METLSSDQLALAREMAMALVPHSEIAVAIGMDADLFAVEMNKPESDIYKSVNAGFLITKTKIQKSVIEMAQRGSSPAQAEALRLIKQFNISNA